MFVGLEIDVQREKFMFCSVTSTSWWTRTPVTVTYGRNWKLPTPPSTIRMWRQRRCSWPSSLTSWSTAPDRVTGWYSTRKTSASVTRYGTRWPTPETCCHTSRSKPFVPFISGVKYRLVGSGDWEREGSLSFGLRSLERGEEVFGVDRFDWKNGVEIRVHFR